MTYKIVQSDEKRTTFHKQIKLDTSRDTAILIRQSRKGSQVAHYESRLLQESLIPFVMQARGDSEDTHIRIYDEGSGVSGTLGMDKRLKLRGLLEDIVNGLIGDIVVARADRLFRDKHFQNVSTFTILAEKMGIRVIVPTSQGVVIYAFKNTKDLQTFQQDMQAAYAYIENQIGYMNRARDYKKSRGLYGGGCLSLPYVLLRDMPKEEQIPVIYEAWRPYALDLFQQFAAFNFETGRMARYIESKPYLFPAMPAEDLEIYKPVTNMKAVPGGYTFSNPRRLLDYLSNVVLGGYAHGGKDEGNNVLIAGAFEAAIPVELLEPSYAAIKGYYLDGSPYERAGGSRQYRRNTIETEAILHGLLTSGDGVISVFSQLEDQYPIYACLKGGYLGQTTRAGLGRVLKAWTLPCSVLDSIILERLIALAEFDQGMVERIKAYFEAATKEGTSRLEVLDIAIQQTQAALKRLSKTIVLLSKGYGEVDEETELDPDDPIVKEHRKLAATLRNLQRQRQEAAIESEEDPAQSIDNFYYVLSHLRSEFNKKPPQTKKDIIRKLIEEVEVNAISPHLYTLHITWIRPMASVRDDVALLWRSDPTRNETTTTWLQDEDEAVRTLYPDSPQIELMQGIPNKSPAQIKKRAGELAVRRKVGIERNFWWTVTYKDLEAAAQFTSNAEEQAFLWQEINTMAENTQRGQLSASWFLPLDMVSFSHALFVTDEIDAGQSRTLASWL
jgi:hypothetical protein